MTSDFKIQKVYKNLLENIVLASEITDQHARNMCLLTAQNALESFKIWFGDDLERLGIEPSSSTLKIVY